MDLFVKDSTGNIVYNGGDNTALTQYKSLSAKRIISNLYVHSRSIITHIPRYVLHIIDSTYTKRTQCTLLIVPNSKIDDWFFVDTEGQLQLVDDTNLYARIILVFISPIHYSDIKSVKQIQTELADLAKILCNIEHKGDSIPFTTLPSADFDQDNADSNTNKKIIYQSDDGDILVDEYQNFRRLFFLSNPFLIQSSIEISLNKKFDFTVLHFNYHQIMAKVLTSFLYNPNILSDIVIIGLGAGSLPMYFFQRNENKSNITVIENSSAVIQVAINFFDLAPQINVVNDDGIRFVKNLHENSISLLLCDVNNSQDSNDVVRCPNRLFLEVEYLSNCFKSLTADGVYVFNLACRSNRVRNEIMETCTSIFPSLAMVYLSSNDEINKIVFAFKKYISAQEASNIFGNDSHLKFELHHNANIHKQIKKREKSRAKKIKKKEKNKH